MWTFKPLQQAFCATITLIVSSTNVLADDEITRSVHVIEAPSEVVPAESAPAAPPAAPVNAPRPEIEQPTSPNILQNSIGDSASLKVANSAELSVEILPTQAVSIGSNVVFRITTKKAGYLILIDIDAIGKITQIYPNTALLSRGARQNANYIKPGVPFLTPSPSDPYAGVAYVVSPPVGNAMVVAILSDQPVQLLDLPDTPLESKDQMYALNYLAKWINDLRIAEVETGRLREGRWSFNARPYSIQQ